MRKKYFFDKVSLIAAWDISHGFCTALVVQWLFYPVKLEQRHTCRKLQTHFPASFDTLFYSLLNSRFYRYVTSTLLKRYVHKNSFSIIVLSCVGNKSCWSKNVKLYNYIYKYIYLFIYWDLFQSYTPSSINIFETSTQFKAFWHKGGLSLGDGKVVVLVNIFAASIVERLSLAQAFS